MLTDVEAFQTAIQQEAVVVFTATSWCLPCRFVHERVLPDVRRASSATVEIVEIDVDEHPELARQYGVTSLPTLVRFSGGEPASQHVGAASADDVLRLAAR